jgi:uncharacterized delta-60 repeat protein
MQRSTILKFTALSFLVLPTALFAACSSDDSSDGNDGGAHTGGSQATGGSRATGGGGSTGGAPSSSGGSTNGTGGGNAVTGGSPSSGGAGSGTPDGGDDGPKPIINAFSATGQDRFYGVTYDDDGNLFAVGQISESVEATADFSLLLAKFKPDGSLDQSFGTKGVVTRNVATGTNGELFRGVVVQSTGKIVVSGSVEHVGATDVRDRDIAVLRFNADGTKDTAFGTDGVVTLDLSTGVVNGSAFSADSVWGLSRYDDDRLVVSGGKVHEGALDTDFVLVRLTADGTRDDAFGDHGLFSLDTKLDGKSNNASPRNPTILPNGEGVLGAGYQPIPGADTGPIVYKVKDDGTLDASFGTDGVFSERPLAEQTESYQAVVQPNEGDGGAGYKIVTTGYGRALESETTDLVSLRLTSDGKIDKTYGAEGLVRIDVGGFGDNSRRVLVLPDRRIALIGGGRLSSADVDGLVAILTPDGAPDARFSPIGWKTFDLGGPADFLWSAALSPDKKTLGLVGIKGVGATPTPATLNDDTALLLLPIPQ